MIDKSTVKNFDLERYMGDWYEIARYPHSFEKGFVGATISYSKNAKGKLDVFIRGFKGSFDGKLIEAKGIVDIPDPVLPSKMNLTFFRIFRSDYLVLEIHKEYQWAIVVGSSKYLWILSRTPQMDEAVYNHLLEKVKQRGYDLKPILKVEQRALINTQ